MAGTLTVDTIKTSATLTPPVFQDVNGTQIGTLCRAWVQFNGSTAAINGAFNVSSVTRNSTGLYTLTFSNNMPDVNYALTGSAKSNAANAGAIVGEFASGTRTTSQIAVAVVLTGTGQFDASYVECAIFR